MLASVRACVRACMRACVHAGARAGVRADVHACWRARVCGVSVPSLQCRARMCHRTGIRDCDSQVPTPMPTLPTSAPTYTPTGSERRQMRMWMGCDWLAGSENLLLGTDVRASSERSQNSM